MREGEFISDHDVKVANWAAYALCGGKVTPGTLVSEQYLLDLEREAFLSLVRREEDAGADCVYAEDRKAVEELGSQLSVRQLSVVELVRLMKDVIIASAVRTAVGKAPRGALRTTRPDDLAAFAINGALERVPQLDRSEIEDVILGCAMPEAEQGLNVARVASFRAGLPVECSAMTINRFCSSGLAVDCDGGGADSRRRGGGDRGGRRGEHVVCADGRQQAFAESVAGGELSGVVPVDGADGGAGGEALRDYARADGPVLRTSRTRRRWRRLRRGGLRMRLCRFRLRIR